MIRPVAPADELAERRRGGRRRREAIARLVLASLGVAQAHCAATPRVAPETPRLAPAAADAPPPQAKERLERAQQALATSRYAEAERVLASLLTDEAQHAPAARALARVWLATGRYADVLALDTARLRADGAQEAAHVLRARAARALGRWALALQEVQEASAAADAFEARLLEGELLLERGRRDEAERALMSIIAAYNDGVITDSDARRLPLVGRAASLLRSPHDANDAYDLAEAAGAQDPRTLLWRSELMLDNHNPEAAHQLVKEVLELAPEHAEALAWHARIVLDAALDFDRAERLAQRALATNPRLSSAYFVMAGIALRDMELERAEEAVSRGLALKHDDLELLSLRATTRFLAEDGTGFAATERRVLTLNPRYSGLYRTVGQFADWEHRYDDIVALMHKALALDADDARARAELGINLIRSGQEQVGLTELQRAFERDPFDVRVFNTLQLYDERIASDYVTRDHGPFRIRYHRAEEPILSRYVPELLDRAWQGFVRDYGFVPQTPVGVELYAERESFSVRTSGLPYSPIQGVCFGKTLASVTPIHEPFNLGMTLWHELSHVFHIQATRSRVPRWFTEGLAEQETVLARAEWRRQLDPELYLALDEGRLPSVENMNRAFTRAEYPEDVGVAYYASGRLVAMMMERFGRQSLRQMLAAWGQGKPAHEVVSSTIGRDLAGLDRDFRAWLRQELSRYRAQFLPRMRDVPLDEARARVREDPKDVLRRLERARAAATARHPAEALRALDRARALAPRDPNVAWTSALIALARGERARAARAVHELVSKGHDGYHPRLMLARLARARGDGPAELDELAKACTFDPTQSEPLFRIAELASETGERSLLRRTLEALTALEQHRPQPHRQLLRLLLDMGEPDAAIAAGEAALWADIEGTATHQLLAEAFESVGELGRSAFELESALACPAPPNDAAQVHGHLAELYQRLGRRQEAAQQRALSRAANDSRPAP